MSDPGPPKPPFQGPRGTRDFYPADMLRRRFIEDAWRRVSIRHGFDEIEGPTFEYLDLYRLKSGAGIVSELFAFTDRGGRELALRPEFTPTLARLFAAKANALPRPTKWFAIPLHYRAERPQRGRLREFVQWNVDLLGDPSAEADAEVIATAVEGLRALGLTSKDVTVRLSNRAVVHRLLNDSGVAESQIESALVILDRRDRTAEDEFAASCRSIGLDWPAFSSRLSAAQDAANGAIAAAERGEAQRSGATAGISDGMGDLVAALTANDVIKWCEFDFSVVRGLAYYTGTVFEIHEASGEERAIAGGGRYDNLIETFGGPPTPAVGFGMGDVVLSLVMDDKGLWPDEVGLAEKLNCRPDAFVVCVKDDVRDRVTGVTSALRRAGLHTRRSYKATGNLGKLLKDASACGARFVVILGDELQRDEVVLKDLATGEQQSVPLAQAADSIRRRVAARA